MTVDCSAVNNIYAIPRLKDTVTGLQKVTIWAGKTQQSQTQFSLGYQNWACEQSGTGAGGPVPHRSTAGYGQVLGDGELFPLVVYQLVIPPDSSQWLQIGDDLSGPG